jgi:hypothetical protein
MYKMIKILNNLLAKRIKMEELNGNFPLKDKLGKK